MLLCKLHPIARSCLLQALVQYGAVRYTPTLRLYRGCYVTDVFAYLVISSVLRALAAFYIQDPTTQT